MAENSVHGLLATGSNDQMTAFHLSVTMRLNCIQTRGQTTHYTCLDEDLDFAVAHAKRLQVTLQEIISQNGEEKYKVLLEGDLPVWKPSEAATEKRGQT